MTLPTSTTMQVAHTILEQLGGSRFLAMTWARDLVGSPDALAFSLPRFTGVKARRVRIVLDASDTYTLTTYDRFGAKLEEHSGVYCDTLARTFTKATGLEVTL